MIRKLTGKIKKNRWLRKTVRAALALIYAVVFCSAALSSGMNLSGMRIDDRIYQKGIDLSQDILTVGISAEDIAESGLNAGVLAARVAEVLNEDGFFYPAAIGLDIPVSALSDEAEDILGNACGGLGNVVLPADLSLPADCLLQYSGLCEDGIAAISAIVPSVSGAGEIPVGHTYKITDESGVVRHQVFDIEAEDGTVYRSMPSVCYSLYCKANGIQQRNVILSEQNTALVKFADRRKTGLTYSASDILEGRFDRDSLSGKIVFVGFSDSSLSRGYLSAIDYGEHIFGVELDAHFANALMTGNMAVVLPMWLQFLLLTAGVLLILAAVSFFRPFTAVLACGIYVLLERIIAMLIYGIGYAGYSSPHIMNALITGSLGIAVASWIRSNEKNRELEQVLGQYVDTNIAKNILKNSDEQEKAEILSPSVKTERIAVLFADIRNFTAISERLSEEKLVDLLNTILSLTADCVNKYGGTLDKFIGDCTMAYWGAPTKDKDPAYHACLAAAEMQRMIRMNHDRLKKEFGEDIHIGIGINYGNAVVGNIGSEERKNFTAVGNTVNTASRLEEAAPADQIYISQEVVENLGGRAEFERLSGDKLFKGKEKPMPVYILRSISVERAILKENASPTVPVLSRSSRRGYVLALMDLLIFFVQFFFTLNCIREYGISYISYFTVNLTAVSCAISALLVPYDIQSAARGDGVNVRPHWLDILLLTGLAANLHCAVAFLIHVVPVEGLSAFLGSSWPGGIMIYAVCPILAMIGFFVLQKRSRYTLADIIFAELPLALLLFVSAAAAKKLGVRYSAPKLYKAFYQFPATILIVIIEAVGIGFLYLVNERLRLQEKVGAERRRKKKERRAEGEAVLNFFGRSGNLAALMFVGNIVTAVLSVRVPINAFEVGGIRLYATPVLVSSIVTMVSAAGAVFAGIALLKKETVRNMTVFRYLSYAQAIGCSMNFGTVLVVALSGGGIAAFFEPRYGADATVFLLCPAIVLFMWLLAQNEYRFLRCLVVAIPYMLIPPLSRAAIISRGLGEQFRYELENFYNTKQMIVVISTILLLAVFFYYISRAFNKNRRRSGGLALIACGNRNRMNVGGNALSSYGLHTDCYVLRDGEYGLVINAGSGLQNAAKQLTGCRRVDILLSSREFVSVAGFLSVGNVCPEAKIRIYSVFDIGSFSVHPFWPVNLVKGTQTRVVPGRRYHLGKGYAVSFIPGADENKFMLKISGRTSLFFLGEERRIGDSVRKMIYGSEWLIVSGCDDYSESCYLAIDCSVSRLMITGFPSDMTDEELDKRSEASGKILSGVAFAKENEVYPA